MTAHCSTINILRTDIESNPIIDNENWSNICFGCRIMNHRNGSNLCLFSRAHSHRHMSSMVNSRSSLTTNIPRTFSHSTISRSYIGPYTANSSRYLFQFPDIKKTIGAVEHPVSGIIQNQILSLNDLENYWYFFEYTLVKKSKNKCSHLILIQFTQKVQCKKKFIMIYLNQFFKMQL